MVKRFTGSMQSLPCPHDPYAIGSMCWAERRLGEMMAEGKDDHAPTGRRWDNGFSHCCPNVACRKEAKILKDNIKPHL
jgi:hypothetical protein